MALLNHRGEPVTPEEIIKNNFTENELKEIFAASDMDYTMYDNDLGPLVFLEKLADPRFWILDLSEFAQILLPKKRRGLVEEGAAGKIPELDKQLCRLGLTLVNDIIELYKHIQKIETSNGNGPNGEQSLIFEFARKMMELDDISYAVDVALSQKIHGEILMRTRFFAGKHPGVIADQTKKVFEIKKTSVDRYIELPISKENEKRANQQVTEEMISSLRRGKSPNQKIDRYVKTIADTRDFIAALVKADIPAIVATGNLKAIAKTAIKNSDYAFMQDQEFRRKHGDRKPPPLVVGTWLRDGENGTLHPRVDGEAVLGDHKAERVQNLAVKLEKNLLFAFGDSLSDGRMLQDALKAGGVVMIVGKTIEGINKTFHRAFDGTSPETNPKIYCSVKI